MIIAEIPEKILVPVLDESGNPVFEDDDEETVKWKETTVLFLRGMTYVTEQGDQLEGTQIVSYDVDGKTFGNDIKEVIILKTKKNAKIRSNRSFDSAAKKRRRTKNKRRDNNSGDKENVESKGSGGGLRHWDDTKTDGGKEG